MDVSPKVIEIIAREQHLDVTKITLDSTFAELGIDSLDGVNILFALEEEFKLDIPDTRRPEHEECPPSGGQSHPRAGRQRRV